METVDPATGIQLPQDAIQRILFIAPSVHVYNIPSLTSTKGYVAATWTADNNKRQIFTARLRILETATSSPHPVPSHTTDESVKIDILLEDPSTGHLFAAAPYTQEAVVEQVLDSSRFFAVRVQGEGGRKAVLGIGFEERGIAFDFCVSLQEARKTLGIEKSADTGGAGKKGKSLEVTEEKRDFSLKEGETITINIGQRASGKGKQSVQGNNMRRDGGTSLPPPSLSASKGLGAFLPPPPTAQEVKAQNKRTQGSETVQSGVIQDLGFDDGEFGEFQ